MKCHAWILAVVVAATAVGQDTAERPHEVDVTKRRVVERPTEELVRELSPSEVQAAAPQQEAKPAPADRTKRMEVERAAEAIVRETQPAGAADESTAGKADDNPRVEPGKVRWRDDVAAAITAAKESGKPVLVFHLLGQLDQRFT